MQVSVAPDTLVMVAELAATALASYFGIAVVLIDRVSDPSLVSSVPVDGRDDAVGDDDDDVDRAVTLAIEAMGPVNVPFTGGSPGVPRPRSTPAPACLVHRDDV